ncbi:MAG: tripartite tricarboxylate transporter permease, partial [Bilophila wadsworthia]
SEYGGSIPSILINTPGTAAALCTTFDGYPMAMKGQAQKALFTALISSVFGGIFGVSALLFLSVPLANVSMKFGAPEQFWLCVFALTIIASLSSGNVLKGVIGALIGLVLACVGMDPVTGYPRFTFNTMELMGGINVVPALIGLFAIPQALLLLRPAGEKGAMAPYNPAPGVFWQTLKDFFRRIWVTLVAGVIGVIVGIMPGAAATSAFAYNETSVFQRNWHRREGIAPVCWWFGGAQIPMLTLGIPGSAPAAVMLGALMTHGLKPGFDLFSEQGDIVFTYTFGLILSNFIILLLGLVLVRIFVRALKIPQHFLVVAILALSVVGSYSISSSLMDVLSMAACGLLGYVLVRYKYGVAPMALGLILGTTMEEGFKLSLHLGAAEGNIMLFFFSRPQSLALIILTLLSLGYSIWKECGAKKV